MSNTRYPPAFQEEAGRFYIERYNVTSPGQFPQKAWNRTLLEREAAAGNNKSAEYLRRYNDDGCYPSSATVVATHGSWGNFLQVIGLKTDPRKRLAELKGSTE